MESRVAKSKSCLEQVLHSMMEHQKSRNYVEAEKLRKEANQLKGKIETLQKKSAKRRQVKEKEDMVEIQIKQIVDLQDKWRTIMEEAEQQGQQMLKQQEEYHQTQLEIHQNQFQKHPEEYHDSGAAIELRRKQQKFAKQGNFMEAHQMQQERLKLQEQEKEMLKKLRAEKLKMQIKKLKLKQKAERQAMVMKISSKMEELKKLKNEDQKILNQKHKNVKREFAFEHQKQNLIQTGLIKNSAHWVKSLSPETKTRSRHYFLSSQKIPNLQTS